MNSIIFGLLRASQTRLLEWGGEGGHTLDELIPRGPREWGWGPVDPNGKRRVAPLRIGKNLALLVWMAALYEWGTGVGGG